MAENLRYTKGAQRAKIYAEITPQIEAVCSSESNLVANLANITAMLKEAFGFFWVGFYVVDGEELVLAPFQGPLACTRIRFGRGVCGKAAATAQTIIVEDVELFADHIACSSLSKSEIVVPIFDAKGEIWGVIDVDSDRVGDFSQVDAIHLEAIASFITKLIEK